MSRGVDLDIPKFCLTAFQVGKVYVAVINLRTNFARCLAYYVNNAYAEVWK